MDGEMNGRDMNPEKSTPSDQIKNERILAFAILIFSAVFVGGSLHLKVGDLSNPGSGMMPLIIGILLLVCSFFYLVRAFNMKSIDNPTGLKEKSNHWIPFAIAGAVLIYSFILNWLNFLLATFLMVLTILRVLQYKNIFYSIVVALLMTLLTYLLFARVLGVSLPSGSLEYLLL
jgi:putative tricarboxylic transport membrane protein